MIIGGIDTDLLTASSLHSFPGEIPGRVLQLDGDVLVYQCGYNNEDSLKTCIDNYFSALEYRRRMTRSSHVNVHLTGNNKGGRFDIAKVKQYQVDRNKNKPEYVNLRPLKDYLCSCSSDGTFTVILHEDQEADDGMAQGNFAAIQAGTPNLSVIMSIDKDLRMCSGFHCNWENFDYNEVSGYGSIYLDETGSTKKVKGFGTAFFWAQLIMGDTADSIPGLPALAGDLLNVVDPTAKVAEDLIIISEHTADSAKYKAARKRLDARKPKACGPVLTYNLLKDCKNDYEAMRTCVLAYRSYYGNEEFTFSTWDGYDIKGTSAIMLREQAELLWMRRVQGENVQAFFKDVIQGRDWNAGAQQK